MAPQLNQAVEPESKESRRKLPCRPEDKDVVREVATGRDWSMTTAVKKAVELLQREYGAESRTRRRAAQR